MMNVQWKPKMATGSQYDFYLQISKHRHICVPTVKSYEYLPTPMVFNSMGCIIQYSPVLPQL